MKDPHANELPLGRQTPPATEYAPQLLFPIPRSEGRRELKQDLLGTAHGFDIWHAYELSWLDASGKPVVRIGRFTIPADSPNIIESKSLKLYLNSLNGKVFVDVARLEETLAGDLAAVAGAPVGVEVLAIDDPEMAVEPLEALCIDGEIVTVFPEAPDPALLKVRQTEHVDESLCSHLLRSLCPVTGQPDWASLRIRYRGPAIDRGSLLSYLLGFRNHREFHEQCVERMYCDLLEQCGPESLTVQAFYTRRGGLDINPLRSTEKNPLAGPRLQRQ